MMFNKPAKVNTIHVFDTGSMLNDIFILTLYNNYASGVLNQNNYITNSLACKVLI